MEIQQKRIEVVGICIILPWHLRNKKSFSYFAELENCFPELLWNSLGLESSSYSET
jgi:hypothetical protein